MPTTSARRQYVAVGVDWRRGGAGTVDADADHFGAARA